MFKHKIICLKRPKKFNECKNTTDEIKYRPDAFQNKNITKSAIFIKFLTIGLYKTYNANLVKGEAACRTLTLENENKKLTSVKGLDKLIGDKKSIKLEVIKTIINKNVEEKLEKDLSKKKNDLTKFCKEIEGKQKEFEKKNEVLKFQRSSQQTPQGKKLQEKYSRNVDNRNLSTQGQREEKPRKKDTVSKS